MNSLQAPQPFLSRWVAGPGALEHRLEQHVSGDEIVCIRIGTARGTPARGLFRAAIREHVGA